VLHLQDIGLATLEIGPHRQVAMFRLPHDAGETFQGAGDAPRYLDQKQQQQPGGETGCAQDAQQNPLREFMLGALVERYRDLAEALGRLGSQTLLQTRVPVLRPLGKDIEAEQPAVRCIHLQISLGREWPRRGDHRAGFVPVEQGSGGSTNFQYLDVRKAGHRLHGVRGRLGTLVEHGQLGVLAQGAGNAQPLATHLLLHQVAGKPTRRNRTDQGDQQRADHEQQHQLLPEAKIAKTQHGRRSQRMRSTPCRASGVISNVRRLLVRSFNTTFISRR